MALFGKKTSDDSAKKTAPQSKDKKAAKSGGLALGRKKKDAPDAASTAPGGATANGGVEDFSDFSDAALSAPAASNGKARSGKADKAARKPSRPRVVNGTSIGLNIGNDSIKVVELQAKGSDIAVTAMGMMPTPAESISNGVVMSVGTLQHAVRDLFKQAGIKSKRVTISVAGTGALVVRVIEVPRMTDKELDANMQQDADRYIPFPPSEVIMDYKALRELPSDPDSPNMDVLLAAAQREIIDLHIKVIEEAKLEPRAIEVEPLAVSRALTQSVTKQAQALQSQSSSNGSTNDDVDYSKVSAIINIGAAGTEISVLRGDVLVFTRTVPNGGNALTQALVDYMGLPWHDAERVKREWGDALPPHVVNADLGVQSTLGATTGNGTDDWSEFGGFDAGPSSTPTSDFSANDVSTILDDDAPQTPRATGQEPREQHGQKEDDADEKPAQTFNFGDFKFSDDDAPATQPASPAATTPEAGTSQPTTDEADLSFALDDAATTAPASAPAAPNFSFGSEPVASPASDAPAVPPTVDPFDLDSFNLSDDAAPAVQAAGAQAAGTDAVTPFDLAVTDAVPSATPPVETTAVEAPASAWNLDDLGVQDAAATTPATSAANDFPAFDLPDFDAANSSATAGATAPATGDFNLDTFFDTPTSSTAAPAELGGDFANATDGVGGGVVGADDFDTLGFGNEFGADLTGFGAGLADPVSAGVDGQSVYAVLHPLLEELANEIRRSLEYHASRYPDAVVQNITLVGGGAQFKNIDVYLTQTLGIPTVIGQPLARLSMRASQLPAGYAEANGPLFTVALGLALRDLVS